MKVHHVGYLVKSISASMDFFINLGYVRQGNTILDSMRKVKIQFISNGPLVVELIESLSSDSDVASFFKRVGVSPYHICYICENFNEDLTNLINNGYIMLKMPTEAIAINGKKVAFLASPQTGLIELVES